MQILEISDSVAEQIKQLANKEQLTTSQFIERLLLKYKQDKEPTTLQDFWGTLEDSPSFKGDPLEIQRQLRNEWDR